MIGEALRLLRVYNDVKLTELAKELDVSAGFLSEVETDKRRPNLELIEKYANRFNVRPSAIMFFGEELDGSTLKGTIKASIRDKLILFMQMIEKSGSLTDEQQAQKP